MPDSHDIERRFALEGENLRQEASSPTTSPERLTELAQIALHGVREVVASNPATPCSVLLELVSEFPEAVERNPMFLPWLRRESQLLATLDDSVLCGLAHEFRDEWLLTAMIHLVDARDELAEVIVENPALPPAVLIHLSGSRNAYVGHEVMSHPGMPADWLAHLDSIGLVFHEEEGSYREHPGLTAADLEPLFHGGPALWDLIARHTTDERQLEQLVEQGDRQTRLVLAGRPLSDWLARALLVKADEPMWQRLRDNDTLPVWAAREVLRALARSAPEPEEASLVSIESRRQWLRLHGDDVWDDCVPF